MKTTQLLFGLIFTLTYTGCTQKDLEKDFEKDKTFGEVKNLSESKQTGFVPTLESPFNVKNNTIYAASLVLCWHHLKEKITGPYQHIQNEELLRMENSKTFQDVLTDKEYTYSVTVEDGYIKSKAFFKKSLPFKLPFEKDPFAFRFDHKNVTSFGFSGHTYNSRADILYYNTDNDFSIRLLTQDSLHEIVLLKTPFGEETTLGAEINKMAEEINTFHDNQNDNSWWRTYFNDEDSVRIPMIEFNIETNYKNIEGAGFESKNGSPYTVATVYQRTAFILNEKGAEVESKAEVEVKEAPPENEEMRPKKLFFNKPFIIMLKRIDQKYPYFCMLVSNAELMKSFERMK